MAPEELLLRDMLLATKDGEWGQGEPGDDLVSMAVIRGTDFESVRLGDLSGLPIRFIPKHVATRKALRPRDIVIETAGGTKGRPTGRTVYLRDELIGASPRPVTCASFSRFLRVNPEFAEPEYVYWYLQYLYAAGEMEHHQVQHTGVARFQYTAFAASTTIPLPGRERQRSVCDVLRRLDERIALNRTMNRTLESIARAIFKSWFVDFDPVRKKMEGGEVGLPPDLAALFPSALVPSAVGSIPEGWVIGTIEDLFVLQRGFDLPKELRTTGPYPVLTASGPAGSHSSFAARGSGVVTGRSGRLGGVWLVESDFWPLNTVLWVKEFRAAGPLWTYQFLQLADLERFNSGSAVPTLNRNHVHVQPALVPPASVVSAFERLAEPLFARRRVSLDESVRLSGIRDAVVPRLLSGGRIDQQPVRHSDEW